MHREGKVKATPSQREPLNINTCFCSKRVKNNEKGVWAELPFLSSPSTPSH